MTRSTYNIAVLPGDGIGPEITPPSLEIMNMALAGTGKSLAYENLPMGATCYAETGTAMPEATLKSCREADAILLAAMGLPDIRYPDGTEITPQIDIRIELDLYAGVRPVRIISPSLSPLKDMDKKAVDFVLVRESTEGLFHSRASGDAPGEIIGNHTATEKLQITRETTERLFDFSFKLAEKRAARYGRKGRVTCVDKANVFRAFKYMRDIGEEIAASYSDIDYDSAYVDAMALKMVQSPANYDVMVTENMFGDILSDLGAGLMGGLGMAPSADIGDKHAVFQPCHGTAPDIAGQGLANPTAMILSGAMMLDWLGETHGDETLIKAAQQIESAVTLCFENNDVRSTEFGGKDGLDSIVSAIKVRLNEVLNAA